jgi:hypothetical protein
VKAESFAVRVLSQYKVEREVGAITRREFARGRFTDGRPAPARFHIE